MNHVDALPDFSTPDLAKAVEALSDAERATLPFGAIRLDAGNAVTYYSEAERRLSGSGDRQRLGLHFFDQIAPCMSNPEYRGRLEQARENGNLDLEFTHIGDFEDRERELTVRIQSASDGGCWIFMRRES